MIAVCVLLGFALWALLFGPLFLGWWWSERRDRRSVVRREPGPSREVRG